MTTLHVPIKKLHPALGESIPIPEAMSEHAAGLDVAAALEEPVTLGPMERRLIPAGFSMAIPEGYECQVRPRSGLAIKYGVTLVNTPGTIDADYRGEVRVILINLGAEPFTIQPGERIAQLVFAPVTRAALSVVAELEETGRGQGGFGSTGR